MLPSDHSPSLTLTSCQEMSTATSTSSAVLSYQQHASSAVAASHSSLTLDLSDPGSAPMALLRNMESVYFQSMTKEDENNKMLRDKVHAEDQIRRLTDDKERLAEQLQAEKSRGTTAQALSQELVSNAVLMKDILNKQQAVKKLHDDDCHMVRDLHKNSAAHRAVLKRLIGEVRRLQEKQAERKKLKLRANGLATKVQALQVQLGDLEKSLQAKDQALADQESAARAALDDHATAKESECKQRLAALRKEMEEQAQRDLARRDAQSDCKLKIMRDEICALDQELARVESARKEESNCATSTMDDLKQRHAQDLDRVQRDLSQARETHAKLMQEQQSQHAALVGELKAQLKDRNEAHASDSEKLDKLSGDLEELQREQSEAKREEEAWNTKYLEATAKNIAVASENAELSQKLRVAEKERAEATDKANRLQTEAREQVEAAQRAEARLARERDDLRARVNALEQAAEDAVRKHEREQEKCAREHEQTTRRLEQMMDDANALRKQLLEREEAEQAALRTAHDAVTTQGRPSASVALAPRPTIPFAARVPVSSASGRRRSSAPTKPTQSLAPVEASAAALQAPSQPPLDPAAAAEGADGGVQKKPKLFNRSRGSTSGTFGARGKTERLTLDLFDNGDF